MDEVDRLMKGTTYRLPKLTQKIENLNRPITNEEIEIVTKKLKIGKLGPTCLHR